MNRQQARRLVFWRGSFRMLTACTALMLFGALADLITQ
jgi:hypothetical protein